MCSSGFGLWHFAPPKLLRSLSKSSVGCAKKPFPIVKQKGSPLLDKTKIFLTHLPKMKRQDALPISMVILNNAPFLL
jgi:hypothetical protein